MPCAFFAQGKWDTVSSIGFTPRSHLTSHALDGKIYTIGGYDGKRSMSILEVYDPAKDMWSTPKTVRTMHFTAGHASGVIGGKIYVVGGTNFGVEYAFNFFDPTAGDWFYLDNAKGTFTPRDEIAAAVIGDSMYVLGGSDKQFNRLNTVEVFNATDSSWSTPATTGTFTARGGLTASVVGGKIYAIGGWNLKSLNTVEIFDPATNSWSTPVTTGYFPPRAFHTASVIDGKIYVVGGYNEEGNPVGSLQVFDPANNSWSTPATAGSSKLRAFLTSSVIGNRMYVLGGYDKINYLNLNEVFIAPASGVKDIPGGEDIILYPNPARETLTISISANAIGSIAVTNVLGEKLMLFSTSSGPDFTLDLSKLVPGTYYIRFSSANSVVTKMVVRE